MDSVHEACAGEGARVAVGAGEAGVPIPKGRDGRRIFSLTPRNHDLCTIYKVFHSFKNISVHDFQQGYLAAPVTRDVIDYTSRIDQDYDVTDK